MKSYTYSKIDAFTADGSLGNPAACLYLKNGQRLSDQQMLAIAAQHKGFVSEVVYCETGSAGIRLTYYSSECEVDFCGHGTIACMYHLIKTTPALLAQSEIPIITHQKGQLTVYNKILLQDTVFITAPEPVYLGTRLRGGTVAQALGLPAHAVSAAYPIDVIDAGLRTLIVPLADPATEISVFPDEQQLKSFCVENDLDIILIFSMVPRQRGYIAHTRVFAPKFGYLEDPATGSGNSAFGNYMLKNSLWDGSDCRIEQGGRDRVFNAVHLSAEDGKVRFGGSATVRIDGVYYA
ncbi:MAG TPA: PhzF family phenazine biosynthesis isomerase [Candidatus Limiplasma sp.]|nr:PhzF family phenazine biosynthesis isomerase [Candidatus Limiplasma sp.]